MHLDEEREEQEDREVFALLRHLDHPPPQIDAHAVAALARRRRVSPVRWAAVIALAVGVAGAAYAIPGSPLPAWVKAAADWMTGGPGGTPVAPPRVLEPEISGIAVAPGQALVILFTSAQDEGRVRVSLTDGAEVRVRAPIGAATFTSDVDRLVINNQDPSATFEIEIPRAAPRVEIRVVGTPIYLKEGSRVTTGR